MGRRRNSVGRNYRKRIARKLQQKGHLEVYSDSGQPKAKVNPVTDVPANGQILAQLKERFLALHEFRLRQCATRLGAPGAWAYYYDNLRHARKLGYEEDFRQLVVSAALRFLGQPVRTVRRATSPE